MSTSSKAGNIFTLAKAQIVAGAYNSSRNIPVFKVFYQIKEQINEYPLRWISKIF
jgi:hypothetical protein